MSVMGVRTLAAVAWFQRDALSTVEAGIWAARVGHQFALVAAISRTAETEEGGSVWAFSTGAAVAAGAASANVAALQFAETAFVQRWTDALEF